jgi:hypothetical protein
MTSSPGRRARRGLEPLPLALRLQLIHDGKRWWVLTVAWAPETPEQPLPAKYLPPSKR